MGAFTPCCVADCAHFVRHRGRLLWSCEARGTHPSHSSSAERLSSLRWASGKGSAVTVQAMKTRLYPPACDGDLAGRSRRRERTRYTLTVRAVRSNDGISKTDRDKRKRQFKHTLITEVQEFTRKGNKSKPQKSRPRARQFAGHWTRQAQGLPFEISRIPWITHMRYRDVSLQVIYVC